MDVFYKQTMSYYLFLDDDREPAIAANSVYPVELRFLYRLEEWVIVRCYGEFSIYITQHGLPKCISFDYDLAKGERNGYDCAIWLIDFCNKHSLELPQILIHSWNPDGRQMLKVLFGLYQKEK